MKDTTKKALLAYGYALVAFKSLQKIHGDGVISRGVPLSLLIDKRIEFEAALIAEINEFGFDEFETEFDPVRLSLRDMDYDRMLKKQEKCRTENATR